MKLHFFCHLQTKTCNIVFIHLSYIYVLMLSRIQFHIPNLLSFLQVFFSKFSQYNPFFGPYFLQLHFSLLIFLQSVGSLYIVITMVLFIEFPPHSHLFPHISSLLHFSKREGVGNLLCTLVEIRLGQTDCVQSFI